MVEWIDQRLLKCVYYNEIKMKLGVPHWKMKFGMKQDLFNLKQKKRFAIEKSHLTFSIVVTSANSLCFCQVQWLQKWLHFLDTLWFGFT